MAARKANILKAATTTTRMPAAPKLAARAAAGAVALPAVSYTRNATQSSRAVNKCAHVSVHV